MEGGPLLSVELCALPVYQPHLLTQLASLRCVTCCPRQMLKFMTPNTQRDERLKPSLEPFKHASVQKTNLRRYHQRRGDSKWIMDSKEKLKDK